MATIITVANQKGGVGKTTSVISLSHGLALRGKNVLIVDLDSQGQCAIALGMQQEPGAFNLLIADLKPGQVIRETGRENLNLIPGDKKTAVAQTVKSAERAPITYIQDALKPISRQYDYVILDTAPAVGDLMGAAIYASDLVLIPTAADFLSSDGCLKLVETMQAIKRDHGLRADIAGVLPTFYDAVTKESQATLQDLKDRFGKHVLTPIHRTTMLRECSAYGKTIYELDAASRAAKEYGELVDHILRIG